MFLSDFERDNLFAKVSEIFYQTTKTVAYTTDGKPLNKRQFVEKIEIAIAEAERGELITDDELEKEIATW